jgi:type II secretion system protein C
MGMRIVVLGGVVGMVLLAGCGGAAPEAASPSSFGSPSASPPPGVSSGPAQRAANPTAPGTIRRSSVREVIAQGPGRFLQHISLSDDAVKKDGKFYGFRVEALHGGDFWDGVDLAPGDVITNVNGKTIERPEQFLETFKSLETAKELRVGIEREGKPRELKWSIVDD